MPINNPKELFVRMLSGALQGASRSAQIYQEMSQAAQDKDIKEALEARTFVVKNDVAAIEQCFKLLGEKPVSVTGRLYDVFVEDFRHELNEIQAPAAKLLFVLAKASHLTHFRIAAYETLIAAADRSGHYGIGVLLETCLADKLAFIERNRRMIRNIVETRVAERLAA